MHGTSYRPFDLSLLKGFSKKFSFEDFHNFFRSELSKAVSGPCLGLPWDLAGNPQILEYPYLPILNGYCLLLCPQIKS